MGFSAAAFLQMECSGCVGEPSANLGEGAELSFVPSSSVHTFIFGTPDELIHRRRGDAHTRSLEQKMVTIFVKVRITANASTVGITVMETLFGKPRALSSLYQDTKESADLIPKVVGIAHVGNMMVWVGLPGVLRIYQRMPVCFAIRPSIQRLVNTR
ncbi:hypothetical protein DFJ77DRAFT_479255 [Powellomyces hirtus]|nr:hypothetical protein DFJ77DRAFT_479255 [Powellomyces hirtus]